MTATTDPRVEVVAERDTLRRDLAAEAAGALAIRAKHGALETETFHAFIDRLAAERATALAERDELSAFAAALLLAARPLATARGDAEMDRLMREVPWRARAMLGVVEAARDWHATHQRCFGSMHIEDAVREMQPKAKALRDAIEALDEKAGS